MKVDNKKVADLVPYEKNTKKHSREQVENVATSIKKYGFVQPLVVDRNNVVVIGHCRLLAAKKLRLERVPCVCVDDLTPDQVKALRIADNKTNESPWDLVNLAEELPGLDFAGFNFNFDLPSMIPDKRPDSAADQAARDAEFMTRMEVGDQTLEADDEYLEFVNKFKGKKTSDDCYTPDNIYQAVLAWAKQEYSIDPSAPIIRPFYPGGDYKKEDYPDGCIVVDNPPFSILSDICRYYDKKNIKYFLFAPTLTLFSTNSGKDNYIAAGVSVTYENGAIVNTSFVSNMGSKILTSTSLYAALSDANAENLRKNHRDIPRYEYPESVLTATRISALAKSGVDFRLEDDEVAFVRGLDAQKDCGKGIFGGGFLLSDQASTAKAAVKQWITKAEEAYKKTISWELSSRELKIIDSLGKKVIFSTEDSETIKLLMLFLFKVQQDCINNGGELDGPAP